MFLGLKKCERKKTFWISVSPSLCGLVAKQSETVTHVTLVGTGIDFYRFQSHTSCFIFNLILLTGEILFSLRQLQCLVLFYLFID